MILKDKLSPFLRRQERDCLPTIGFRTLSEMGLRVDNGISYGVGNGIAHRQRHFVRRRKWDCTSTTAFRTASEMVLRIDNWHHTASEMGLRTDKSILYGATESFIPYIYVLHTDGNPFENEEKVVSRSKNLLEKFDRNLPDVVYLQYNY